MRGFPRHCNTARDYAVLVPLFGDQWEGEWKKLYDDRYCWQFGAFLDLEDEGKTDKKYRVCLVYNEQGVLIQKIQEIWKKNPACKLIKIGMDEEEVRIALDLPEDED